MTKIPLRIPFYYNYYHLRQYVRHHGIVNETDFLVPSLQIKYVQLYLICRGHNSMFATIMIIVFSYSDLIKYYCLVLVQVIRTKLISDAPSIASFNRNMIISNQKHRERTNIRTSMSGVRQSMSSRLSNLSVMSM